MARIPRTQRTIVPGVYSDAWDFTDDAKGTIGSKPRLHVNPGLSKTAFGQAKAEQETPITQIAAEYGILGQVLTVTDDLASGTNAVVNDLFTSQTGTAADGLASILTL